MRSILVLVFAIFSGALFAQNEGVDYNNLDRFYHLIHGKFTAYYEDDAGTNSPTNNLYRQEFLGWKGDTMLVFSEVSKEIHGDWIPLSRYVYGIVQNGDTISVSTWDIPEWVSYAEFPVDLGSYTGFDSESVTFIREIPINELINYQSYSHYILYGDRFINIYDAKVNPNNDFIKGLRIVSDGEISGIAFVGTIKVLFENLN